MDDSIFVDVLYACEDLLHEPDGFSFIETFSFDDVVKEFSAFRILHDEVDVCFGFDDFVELDDVGVTEDFEDTYFTGDAFDVRLFNDFLFLEGFYGDFFFSENVRAQLDFAEGAFADGATDPVVAEDDLAVGSHGGMGL